MKQVTLYVVVALVVKFDDDIPVDNAIEIVDTELVNVTKTSMVAHI